MGNLKSVQNALDYIDCSSVISSNKKDIVDADAYILPGVGAFGEAIHNLNKFGIIELLTEQVKIKKKPFLGICLGMQLISEDSEENGFHKGFGWINSHVIKIKVKADLKLPHVGWSNIDIIKRQPMFNNIDLNANYYFDHNYQFVCDDSYVLAKSKYDTEIIAAVRMENIFATQFHPEKSQINGLRFLRNYSNYIVSS